MKKNKKYILGGILVVLSIILITIFAISVSAENNTEGSEKEIADEKTLVKTIASLSRGSSADDVVDKDTLTEHLNRYTGSGVTSVTEKSSDILLVTFLASGREYEIDVNTGALSNDSDPGSGSEPDSEPEPGNQLPSTAYTTPYLPTGFTPVTGTDLNTGLVIQDSSGNQYVWVEVPRTTTVYPNAGLSITAFTDTECTSIENDLHTYTSVYRNSTSYTDTWYSEAQHGFASAGDYNALKNKMLKSVYENGGFYVGRYETGTVTARKSKQDALTTPVIQANAYPYNFVTNKQAQTLASTEFATGGYTTSLMFGVQWDLVLKYLETKGASQSELNSDSTEWGNYNNNTYNITNTSAKYYSSSWADAPYNKTASGNILLTTGASSEFSKQNISDLAGNVYEWTLEYTSYTYLPCARRGGYYYNYGSIYPASTRDFSTTTNADRHYGFRVSLY